MTQRISYAEAIKRLEAIVNQIENSELEIDDLTKRIKEANELIQICTDKLTQVDQEVEKILIERKSIEE
ncbi:MAG: exodeoxyribonuclease VII small subunit [Bacteroidales bacterium]|nr:exodeoxyribonuclease VII small subunit [Bacteroidales bacterium]